MVVEGSGDLVGLNRAAVLAALREVRPVATAPVTFAPDRRWVRVGAGAGHGLVLLVRFVRHQTTEVAAGENAGRILQDANGVRSLTTLGEWTGPARDFPIEPPAAGEGLALLVQAADGTDSAPPDPSAITHRRYQNRPSRKSAAVSSPDRRRSRATPPYPRMNGLKPS